MPPEPLPGVLSEKGAWSAPERTTQPTLPQPVRSRDTARRQIQEPPPALRLDPLRVSFAHVPGESDEKRAPSLKQARTARSPCLRRKRGLLPAPGAVLAHSSQGPTAQLRPPCRRGRFRLIH